MRKTKEALRMKWELGLSHRQVTRSLSIGLGTLDGYLKRARAAGLESWAEVAVLSEEELEERLFPSAKAAAARPEPDWQEVRQELTKKGVTLSLLWQEYQQRHPDGYGYSRYCELYRAWKKRHDLSMRQEHKAGEKLFVDFSGLTVPIWTPECDEVAFEAEIFVSCLGASDRIYCRAVRSQGLTDWLECHCRAFDFYQGVPEIVVPDNLKSGVTKPCRYDPEINRSYWDLARHYGVAVIPARSGKARDKAKVEQAVQMVQRWVLVPLRHEQCTSLGELNLAMAELLTALDERPMRVYGLSRRELFERIESEALRPLPEDRFEIAEWLRYKVGPDYHVEVDHHYYSVAYTLCGRRLDVRLAARTVEIFDRDRRVASHARSFERGRHTTVAEHMPRDHRAHARWTPERIRRWAAKSGPDAQRFAEELMASRDHPQQGFRACMGVMRLGDHYGTDRLASACRRALAAGALSYTSVASILEKGLDRQEILPELERPPIEHGNVRGAKYYGEGGS